MKLKSYPKYKSSGVEWLGDVPEHWATKAIKWITPVLRGASPRPIDDPVYFDEEGEYAWVRIADVTASKVYLEETTQKLSEVGSSLSVKLKPGALFLSIAATVGVPCITQIKCCIHDGFVYFPRLKANTMYMYYIFACGESYKGLGKLGTQLNLNTDTVGSIVIGVPPLNEQQAIADFLDREIGRIDELISKKELLIERLKEKRTAMISRAVTKGLNPDVRLKPSGVEWLGDVPEHWEIKRLKNLGFFKAGAGFPDDEQGLEKEELPFFKVADMNLEGNEKYMLNSTNTVSRKTAEKLGAYIFQKRTVIFAKVGAALLLNKRRVITKPSCIDNNTMGYVIDKVVEEFIYYWFMVIDLGRLANPGAVPSINDGQLREITIAVPPTTEQQSIFEYLDRETGKIDALVEKVSKAIEKLKEYRTALISAAVTGKIDVRTGDNA